MGIILKRKYFFIREIFFTTKFFDIITYQVSIIDVLINPFTINNKKLIIYFYD